MSGNHFCYEKDWAGRWQPVIYDEKPFKKVDFRIERTTAIPSEGEFTLDELMKKYPPPK